MLLTLLFFIKTRNLRKQQTENKHRQNVSIGQRQQLCALLAVYIVALYNTVRVVDQQLKWRFSSDKN